MLILLIMQYYLEEMSNDLFPKAEAVVTTWIRHKHMYQIWILNIV